jgi:hypothetical protein
LRIPQKGKIGDDNETLFAGYFIDDVIRRSSSLCTG